MLKKIVKKTARKLGWEIVRLGPTTDPFSHLMLILNYIQADIVFDIGANVGQFAQGLRSAGFSGEIISFEPLSSAHDVLSKSAEADSKWKIHPRVAVGDQECEIKINIAGNSVSSSILPMLETHSSASIDSSYVASELTSVIRLDSVTQYNIANNKSLFIKIDTQGFESQVLDGASETLKLAQGVLLELSLIPLYEGQELWQDIIHRMSEQGFSLWAIQKGFTDRSNGRTLQIDGIFLRN